MASKKTNNINKNQPPTNQPPLYISNGSYEHHGSAFVIKQDAVPIIHSQRYFSNAQIQHHSQQPGTSEVSSHRDRRVCCSDKSAHQLRYQNVAYENDTTLPHKKHFEVSASKSWEDIL